MGTTGSGLEYYRSLHTEFSEMCPVVNQYVIKLYARPRKFILETGPMLDQFIREQSMPGTPGSRSFPADAMMEFIGFVDDFTIETIELFNEHKSHVNDCKNYMKKTSELQAGEDGKYATMADYAQLTLEVIGLNKGLTRIKEKADKIIQRLDALETTWNIIKLKINS